MSDTSQARILSRHVLSVHLKPMVAVAKIGAAHYVAGAFRLLVTAFNPTTSAGTQSPDRALCPSLTTAQAGHRHSRKSRSIVSAVPLTR